MGAGGTQQRVSAAAYKLLPQESPLPPSAHLNLPPSFATPPHPTLPCLQPQVHAACQPRPGPAHPRRRHGGAVVPVCGGCGERLHHRAAQGQGAVCWVGWGAGGLRWQRCLRGLKASRLQHTSAGGTGRSLQIQRRGLLRPSPCLPLARWARRTTSERRRSGAWWTWRATSARCVRLKHAARWGAGAAAASARLFPL